MNYWIIATIVICLFIWYIVKCWSKSFEIVNEGALAQEREAILEIIEQERPLEYAHISNIDYRQKKKHIYQMAGTFSMDISVLDIMERRLRFISLEA